MHQNMQIESKLIDCGNSNFTIFTPKNSIHVRRGWSDAGIPNEPGVIYYNNRTGQIRFLVGIPNGTSLYTMDLGSSMGAQGYWGNFDYGGLSFGTSLGTSMFGGAAESTLKGLSAGDAFRPYLKGISIGAKVAGGIVGGGLAVHSGITAWNNPTTGNITSASVQSVAAIASFFGPPGLVVSLCLSAIDFWWGEDIYNYLDRRR
jgi:hypothetical protein